jgi:hypothetical protein
VIATQVVEHLSRRIVAARRGAPFAGRADRARDDQRGVLARVLQQLHPRFARAAGASRTLQYRRASGFSVEIRYSAPVRTR